MPDIAQISEGQAQVSDLHRSQPDDRDSAIELARVAERLDAIHDDVHELVQRVGAQNGRIAKLEAERAAMQSRSVDIAREELDTKTRLRAMVEKCECRMSDMSTRMRASEAFVNQAGGAMKGILGVVRDAMMIFTFLLTAWYMIGERAAATHSHAPEPALQHQAK